MKIFAELELEQLRNSSNNQGVTGRNWFLLFSYFYLLSDQSSKLTKLKSLHCILGQLGKKKNWEQQVFD